MKNNKLRNYEPFYVELPQTDYLNDIEIQDEYDDQTGEDKTGRIKRGLTDEQVSQIAQDSLETALTFYDPTDTHLLSNNDSP